MFDVGDAIVGRATYSHKAGPLRCVPDRSSEETRTTPMGLFAALAQFASDLFHHAILCLDETVEIEVIWHLHNPRRNARRAVKV